MTYDSIGGYRIVRKLGDGERAEVFLAYPAIGDDASVPVAIKAYSNNFAEESVVEEVEALSRAAGEHVVRLVDLASTNQGATALIMEWIPGGSLGKLLRDRSIVRSGEAITLLAPLAMTLDRLHHAGVVHGGLRLEAVSFSASGAPVLACFGRAQLITPGLPPALLEAHQGVDGDLRAFERLARAVLDRLPLPVELPELKPSGWLMAVATSLFALGEPEPIQLLPDEHHSVPPSRIITAEPVPAAPEPRRSSTLLSLGMPEWLDIDALTRRLRAVRRRVWVGLGVVGLALGIALIAIPQGSTQQITEDAASTPSPSPRVLSPAAVGLDPVLGDDPLAALPALLESRAACIRDLSVLCLDSVGHAGSSALADDQQLVRDLQQGAEIPETALTVAPGDLVIEERLGDAALISLGDVADSEPASVLVMKTEAGWRIRDYLER